MNPLIVIGLIVGLPIVLTFLFRINAVTLLLAFCAGDVLQRYASNDAATVLGSLSSHSNLGANQLAHLLLLFLPALFVLVFLRKTVGRSKSILNLLPAVAAGVLAGILTVPLLPGGIQHNIVTTSWWGQVNQYQSTLVGGIMLVAFFMLWFTHPKPAEKGKKHK